MAASQVNQTPTNTQRPGTAGWKKALVAVAVPLIGLVPALLPAHPAPVTNNTSCYSCQLTNGSTLVGNVH
jgi:hypothetical protein